VKALEKETARLNMSPDKISEKFTDTITDELFGIDRLGDAIRSITATRQRGCLKAPLSPSVDITPDPFDTFNGFRLHTSPSVDATSECTTEERPFSLKDESMETEENMLTRSLAAQARDTLEELRAWTPIVNEDSTEQDVHSQTWKNSDKCGPLLRCDEKDLSYVFRNFIASETPALEDGVTLLVHDIPFGFGYRPHIVEMIDSLASIDSVDYIYLPMAVDRGKANQFRNKGFCFIHFSDANMAQKFMDGISNYSRVEQGSENESANKCKGETARVKKLSAVFAKFQGMSTNLHNLLDVESKKWRPKNGFVLVRTDSGLSNISLLELRGLAKLHAKGLTI
jgi:hypothetical protein